MADLRDIFRCNRIFHIHYGEYLLYSLPEFRNNNTDQHSFLYSVPLHSQQIHKFLPGEASNSDILASNLVICCFSFNASSMIASMLVNCENRRILCPPEIALSISSIHDSSEIRRIHNIIILALIITYKIKGRRNKWTVLFHGIENCRQAYWTYYPDSL